VQDAAELLLAASHLAIITFVIESIEVENSVKHKDLYFQSGSMPEGAGVTRRNFG
jgi:hypothetical protein